MSRGRAQALTVSLGDAGIDWGGMEVRCIQHDKGTVIFAQGGPCDTVFHLERGTVRLSVVSHAGKEAVVALLDPGVFFGEGCLVGQPYRIATAHALTSCTTVQIDPQELTRQMRVRPALAERFLKHMLTRNIRIEEDLIDQLFNDAEKRLARILLLMARYGEEERGHRTLPRVSQTILGEMVGTTRSRVNAFMTKFRRLGFIDYNGSLKVHHSLATVLLSNTAGSTGLMVAQGLSVAAAPAPVKPRRKAASS